MAFSNRGLFALVFLLYPAAAVAQHGMVHYTYQDQTTYEVPEAFQGMEGMEELYEQMSAMRRTSMRHVLRFDEGASIMHQDEAHVDSLQSSSERTAADVVELVKGMSMSQLMALAQGGGRGALAMPEANLSQQPITSAYRDFAAGTYLLERPLLTRKFLVSGTVEIPAWRLYEDERQLLGYRLLKATTTVDTLAIEAWYTPEIPVSTGPILYSGLPGLILVTSLEGESGVYRGTYFATHIDLEVAPTVHRPDEGREVTAEEFETIAADKAKEFRDMMKRVGNYFP